MVAWLLDQKVAGSVERHLKEADLVVASDLTLIECDRTLIRSENERSMTPAQAAERRQHLAEAAANWIVLRLIGEIVDRARRPFPKEPLRTLDAIHLSCLLQAQAVVAPVALLSLDDRVVANGRALGFKTLPER